MQTLQNALNFIIINNRPDLYGSNYLKVIDKNNLHFESFNEAETSLEWNKTEIVIRDMTNSWTSPFWCQIFWSSWSPGLLRLCVELSGSDIPLSVGSTQS